MKPKYATLILLFTQVHLALSALQIHNWCATPLYFWVSTSGGPSLGPIDTSTPYTIPSGKIYTHTYITTSGSGTSLKLAFSSAQLDGAVPILQFEYDTDMKSTPPELFYDLSDLDGSSAGDTGSPFLEYNVKVTPTGGTCAVLKCPKGILCQDAYNDPNAVETKVCPLDVGDMWLDICMPDENFNSS